MFWGLLLSVQNRGLLGSAFIDGLQVRVEGGVLSLCVDTGVFGLVKVIIDPVLIFWHSEYIPTSHCRQGGWW